LNDGQEEELMAVAAGADTAAAVVTEELRPAAAGYEDPYTQADEVVVAADDVVVPVDPSPRRTWAAPNAATASGDLRTYANRQKQPKHQSIPIGLANPSRAAKPKTQMIVRIATMLLL
jgi:hypothetical protein